MLGSRSNWQSRLCWFVLKVTLYGSWLLGVFANELLVLEYQHFASLNEKNCPKFNCLVIQKAVTVIGLLLTFLSVSYVLPGNNFSVEMVIVNSLMQFSINCNIMHHYVGVLLIYRYLWLINGQLLELVTKLKLDHRVNSSRIREFFSLYRRLLELIGNIVAAYEYHMTLVLITGIASNILAIYFWIVLNISMNINSLCLLIFPQFLLVNFWNIWLNIVACDLAENAGKRTPKVLKLFADLGLKDIELERSVNEFALLCSHRQFKFHVCGLFTINYNMGFQMIITSVLYLIYLIQFDFMNL
ncbi:LOW QUALITY PROTEIN: putative gustatory receptor 22c [Drosophila santomea]|uniref:LOW QUALITY PROTEIN: putative gustatory receptor 22c n=1 Tax=Drosophila santomea TaxID=129105 RepID=UPI001952C128|nr:LOW QUALITY PROTEIN: putative gustatory receptor 22c [Drosophila santomea]